jgi:glucose/arabinose dehydrogenase
MRLRSNSSRVITVATASALALALNAACDSSTDSPGGAGSSASGSGNAGTASPTGGAGSTTGGTAGVGAGASAGSGTGGSAGSSSGSGNGGGGAAPAGGTSSGGAGGGTGGSGGVAGGANGAGGKRVAGTDGYDCSPATGTTPALQATAVVSSGLTQPIYLTHAPNDAASRLFVVERAGVVRVVKAGSLVTKPFLDIQAKVVAGAANGDERGLLGMAFHPSYATNGLLYVHYSDKADADGTGDTIIEEYKVSSASPDEADATSGRVVLKVEQPTNGSSVLRNHKGGSINFGSDGFLYIGLGDGGGSGDTHASHGTGNGQSLTSLLGKMLRIDPAPSGGSQYSSPPGNLKDKVAAAAPEIWDYGLRNPFRSSFDGCTGDLYIGDVGQDKWEEVDVEKAGDGNKNYGWNKTEGNHCYQPMSGCDEAGITKPVVEYDHNAGKSLTGGAVYRGKSIPGLRGAYVYADYQSNAVWSFVYDREKGTASPPVSLKQDLNNVTSIVSITNGADGELYFVSLMGGVYKLEAAP